MSKSIRDQINLAELYAKVPNRFLLTVAAAKRARQIDDGAVPLIDASVSHNLSLDIALMEIQTGKIVVSIEDVSEEESILDEISDYLDSDILDVDPNDSGQDTPKKRKQTV
ncbi:MAG: DNA-directed RNA polymerase subunit omega [Candidatus Marinamargulisbacteria bacterium]